MFCRCRPIFCFFRPSEVYHAARRRSVCQGVFFADGKLSVRPSGAAGASQGLQKPREGVRPRPPHASSTATPRRGANALTVLEALLSGAFTRRRLATSTFGCDRRTKMRAVHVLGAFSHAFATVAAPQTSIDRRPNPARYARSDRRSANCVSPQLRASSDATAQVGDWSAREGSGADVSMVAIDR
jgi:hypothetical protein